MAFLKRKYKIRTLIFYLNMLLISGFLCNCSDFNQPVVPTVEFTREAYDDLAGIGVSFGYNFEYFTIDLQNNIRTLQSPLATLYITFQNENDFPDKYLSDSSADYRVIIDSYESIFYKENSDISTLIIDRHGDTLGHPRKSICNANKIFIIQLDTLPRDISLFYWQIDFYCGYNKPLRLPETPGIWYFGFTRPSSIY